MFYRDEKEMEESDDEGIIAFNFYNIFYKT